MSLAKAFTYRSFALLWIGQTVSRLGDNFTSIAFAWWVLEKTGSAVAMGTALVFSRVPRLLFLLVGGAVVDRFPRIRVMLISNLLQGSILLLLAWGAAGNSMELWHIFLASALFGLAGAFFSPAISALIPEIVPCDVLPSATSITTITEEATSIIGPLLAGLVVNAGGTAIAFSIDGFSFFFSAILLIFLLKLSVAPGTTSKPSSSLWKDMQEGIRFVAKLPWLWITIAIASLLNVTFGGPVNVALPFLVEDHLHMGADGLGMLLAAFSAGSIVVAAIIGNASQIRQRGIKAYLAISLEGLLIIALGLATSPTIGMVIAIGMGVFFTVFNLIVFNSVQLLVPQEKMGRVSSLLNFGSQSLSPVGFVIAGWAAEQIGPSSVFVIGGVITAILGAMALLVPDIRNLD